MITNLCISESCKVKTPCNVKKTNRLNLDLVKNVKVIMRLNGIVVFRKYFILFFSSLKNKYWDAYRLIEKNNSINESKAEFYFIFIYLFLLFFPVGWWGFARAGKGWGRGSIGIKGDTGKTLDNKRKIVYSLPKK